MKTKAKKPDPIKLVGELAEYIRDKRVELESRVNGGYVVNGINGIMNDGSIYPMIELYWERDFWREKALNP